MIWGAQPTPPEGAAFADWREFIAYETRRRARAEAGESNVPPGVDAAFVCVLDEMHREVVVALSALGGLHIMCEKPLATTLQDCIEMYTALQSNKVAGGQQAVFSIGHVLRYSPHNTLLRKLLLQDRVIGDILSVAHTEPVGWWHFAHSYVRGNWYVPPGNNVTLRCNPAGSVSRWCVGQFDSPGGSTRPPGPRPSVADGCCPGAVRALPLPACSPRAATTSTYCCGSCALPPIARFRIALRPIYHPPSPAPVRSNTSSEAASRPRLALPPTVCHAPRRACASSQRSASTLAASWLALGLATRGGR